MKMFQCELARETETGKQNIVTYIEERGAKVGALVELIGPPEDGGGKDWRVVYVYQPPMESKELREHQRLNRKSLPSILGKEGTIQNTGNTQF